VIWLLTALAALILPAAFRDAVWVTVGGLVLAGVWYVLGLRGRLRDGTAGPPRLPDAASSTTTTNVVEESA
ncbi:MAG TPA: hypothetical protein VH008_03135, partial [Pseudonocardia sp.]|nr:hypothetical protein [Pseudonocardia sp.]